MSAVRAFQLDPVASRMKRLQRSVRTSAKWMVKQAGLSSSGQGRGAFRWLFVTLTYRKVGEWEPRHISDYVRRCREYFAQRGHSFLNVWVAEVQKRGAVHYHLMVGVPRNERLPSPDMAYRDRYGRLQPAMWPHGMANRQTARNPVGYLVKYSTKATPDVIAQLPRGIRMHGSGGFEKSVRQLVRFDLLPRWQREIIIEQEARERYFYDLGEAVHFGYATAAQEREWQCEEDRRREYEEAIGYEALAGEEFDRLDRAARVWDRGLSHFRRVAGGYVHVVDGVFYPTPYVVGHDPVRDADGKEVPGKHVWWCEDRSELRYPCPADAFVESGKPGERWKLGAGFVPLTRERML